MRVLLIEDEKPALEQLRRMVHAWDPTVEICGELGSVQAALAHLRSKPAPDLILCDIQLSDGLSFRIFEQLTAPPPVVFCTAYDEHVQQALATCGIDYVLKPLQAPRLHAALEKYLRLREHFAGRPSELATALAPRPRTRFLVKRGGDFVSVPVPEVAYFASDHKLVMMVDRARRQYLLDTSLTELARELSPQEFFRVNRKFLVSISAVQSVRPHFKGRLALTLAPPVEEPVIVSQETAAAFRAWLGG